MNKLLTLLLIICASSVVFAGDGVTVTPMGDAFAKDYQGEESFETSMPPAGWNRRVTNSACAWTFSSLFPYDGNQCAYVPMDIMGEAIDEQLSFDTSYTATQWLHFAVKGQKGANANLTVWVGEDLVFDFARDWTLPFDQWGLVEIDLGETNYAGFPNVEFAWKYTGTFAPELYLDMVGITESPVGADVSDWGDVKNMFR